MYWHILTHRWTTYTITTTSDTATNTITTTTTTITNTATNTTTITGPIYYRDADGALLVYDITDAESFIKVKKWVKELRKIVGNDIIIAIAGNKIDLEKNRMVNETDAISYSDSVGAQHFHTSAKSNKGLDEVFQDISQRMLSKREKDGKNSNSGNSSNKKKLVIVDDAPVHRAKSGCCWSVYKYRNTWEYRNMRTHNCVYRLIDGYISVSCLVVFFCLLFIHIVFDS